MVKAPSVDQIKSELQKFPILKNYEIWVDHDLDRLSLHGNERGQYYAIDVADDYDDEGHKTYCLYLRDNYMFSSNCDTVSQRQQLFQDEIKVPSSYIAPTDSTDPNADFELVFETRKISELEKGLQYFEKLRSKYR